MNLLTIHPTQAFGTFELDRSMIGQQSDMDSKLELVAKLVSVEGAPCNPEALQHQFLMCRPIAEQESGDTSVSRWKVATKQMQQSRAASRQCSLNEIKCGLAGLIVFKPTTSTIEGTFTKLERAMTSRQQHCDADYEEAVCRIISDLTEKDRSSLEKLAKDAQCAWASLGYGVARASGRAKRPHPNIFIKSSLVAKRQRSIRSDHGDDVDPQVSTEATLRRMQMQDRAAALKDASTNDKTLADVINEVHEAIPDTVGDGVWTNDYKKELKWLRKKEHKKSDCGQGRLA